MTRHRVCGASDTLVFVGKVLERNPERRQLGRPALIKLDPEGSFLLQFLGARLNSVDTEEHIEQRPREWKQQADGDPGKGGPGVALEQQRVHRTGHGHRRDEHKNQPLDYRHAEHERRSIAEIPQIAYCMARADRNREGSGE